MRFPARVVFAAIFVASAGLIGIAMYMQHVVGLEPCPMCILQRIAFIAVGLVALVAAIHGPRTLGVRIYAVFVILFAVLGGGTSIRHSYLQHFPDPAASCGADFDFLINNFSLAQALPKMFAGTGDCSKVQWQMLGLSIPEWALVWYLIFEIVAIWLIVRKPA